MSVLCLEISQTSCSVIRCVCDYRYISLVVVVVFLMMAVMTSLHPGGIRKGFERVEALGDLLGPKGLRCPSGRSSSTMSVSLWYVHVLWWRKGLEVYLDLVYTLNTYLV